MGGQGAGQQFGSDASGRFAAQQMAAAAKGANANREGLQLIPGGVSSGKDRLASIEKSDDPSDILRQIFTPENGEYHHPVYSDSAVFEVLKNGCRYVMHKPIKYVYCKSICDIEYSIVKNRSPLSDSLQFNGKNYKCDPGLDYEYLRSNMCVDANKKITDTEYYLVNGEKCTRKMANVAIPKNITIPMHKE
jgi:hypothetical protein